MDGKRIVMTATALLLLNGCALTVGYEQTYCDENGADYSDAGVCDDPWTIYQNRHALAALNDRSRCAKK